MKTVVLFLLLLLTGVAAADPPRPRPFRWSIGAGSAFLLTGEEDAGRQRLDGHLDIMPGGSWGRFGMIGAIRQVPFEPFASDALVTLGVRYEAAAARPRLVLSLHADLGATRSSGSWPGAPAAGGGIETHFWIWPKKLGPLALVSDVTAHLVVDGTDHTRLVIAAATRLSLAR